LDGNIIAGVLRRAPDIDFVGVQKLGLRGTSDSELLEIAYLQRRVLVSHDRRTMTLHFTERIAAGKHSAGVFIVTQDDRVGEVIESLVLIALASDAEEWMDTIRYLPL
jgi:hypothetical protein